MSGSKTISVDQGAWNRAQRSARELATVRREMPRMLKDVRRQSQADTRRMIAPLERRQNATDHRLGRLSAQTREFEQRTDARLREQATHIRRVQEESRREVRRLDRELRQERLERRRQIAELGSQINDIIVRRDQASALAQAFLADARVMAEEIGTLPHERFAPGRLAVLEGRLAGTTETAAQVDAAYALSSAQDLYYDLSDLRLDVRQAEQEWLAARLEALEALRRADARIEQFAKTPMLDENGVEIPGVVLDLDFWTDGRLTTLRDEVRRETEELADAGCPRSVEELREVIQKHAPGCGYEQRLDELLECGAARMYAAQIRYNTAEKIADALGEEGYDLVEDVYEGGDHRASHFTKLRHLAGEGDVVVEVAPEGNTGMSIKLLSYDRDPAQSRRAERTANMLAKLRDEGVPVGDPVDRGTEPTPEEADFELIQQKRRNVG
ncbi:class III extradiol ring-cleavage dioxygenase family protein [Actinomadura harenae]|uniref:Uncharacterized protein n=1 Tax=Actinomadura harenae TaxID=2483351 RepID=A0A3M2LLB8_9ACTN|nr:hypothetical protein [Actinomadura harenae]RMI38211.1 hypothetical protein EBO15_33605 [Actinomadura harenae]